MNLLNFWAVSEGHVIILFGMHDQNLQTIILQVIVRQIPPQNPQD